MCALNITKATKKMSASDIRDFIQETYYKQIGFSKEDSYHSIKRSEKKEIYCRLWRKLIEKVLDPRNAKQHYDLFLRKKNRKKSNNRK